MANPFAIDVADIPQMDEELPGGEAGEVVAPPEPPPPPMTDEEIVQVLLGYNKECEDARKSGHSARDLVWENNWKIYWNIFDDSQKADWQSRDVMPEAPQFVDRWSSALREALVQSGEWYTVIDQIKKYGGLSKEVKIILDYYLDRLGETEDVGQPLGFAAVFEDLTKLATLSAFCAAVTWKKRKVTRMGTVIEGGQNGQNEVQMTRQTVEIGQLSVEPVDPRTVWFDPTRRGLYRRRRIEMDLHELVELSTMSDSEGKPLFNPEAVSRVMESFAATDRDAEKELSSGTSQKASTLGRKPIVIDEYLCTIIKADGTIAWPANTLVMMANEKEIVRGPEPNPFWHGRDWIVYTPMTIVPLAPYGKSYVEDWAAIAKTFNEMTRMVLDATFAASMNAFVGDANKLEDPTELEEGVHPNKVFQVAEGEDPTKIIQEIELGRLPPESIQVWQGLKQELREGAKLSEIALGQLAPKGDTTATEISESKQSTSSVVRTTAMTLEQRGLDVILDLGWWTTLQHMDLTQEPVLAKALGPQFGPLLLKLDKAQRYRLLGQPYQFRARGISSILDRAKDRNALLAALSLVVSNDVLKGAFMRQYSETKVLDRLLRLYGVDTTGLEREPGEQMPVPQAPPGKAGEGVAMPPGTPPAISGAVLGGAPR